MPTTDSRKLLIGLGRAFGGAVIFALPMLMTMEMWYLGFYMDRLKLALLLVIFVPVLIGLDHFSGFEETTHWWEDVRDAFMGYAVGFVAATVILLLLGILTLEMPLREWVGKISIQAVPASMGAILARSQFGGGGGSGKGEGVRRGSPGTFRGELFIMGVGALFLSFNLAPTEEMLLLSQVISPWHALAIVAVSLALMHAFVYAADYSGEAEVREGKHPAMEFLLFTVCGYVLALGISILVLWLFGRLDDLSLEEVLMAGVVLGLPAAIGAASARLIL